LVVAVTQQGRAGSREGTAASLRAPGALFALGLAVHGADHMRRGMSAAPPSIMVGGFVQIALVVVTLVLVWQGSRRAPAMAVLTAAVSIVGFTYAHLLPDWWPAFSDSFVTGPRIGVTWFSWASVVAELGTALVFVVAGVRALRHG
jgi:hypothetical protein